MGKELAPSITHAIVRRANSTYVESKCVTCASILETLVLLTEASLTQALVPPNVDDNTENGGQRNAKNPRDHDSADVFKTIPIAPTFDGADRRRREMHCATQGVGVAVALEKHPAASNTLVPVSVDSHPQLGIACL